MAKRVPEDVIDHLPEDVIDH
nr:hypothetical protein [Tanacetum cinerariifolium]